MNKFVLTAALAAALGISSGAALAEHHEDGKKRGGMMQRVDTNGDGVVSKAEFMAKHEEIFAKMDANSDGSLSKEEMKAARDKMKEKMKEKHKDRLEKRGNMPDVQKPTTE